MKKFSHNAVLSITKHIWSIKDLPMGIYREFYKTEVLVATIAIIALFLTNDDFRRVANIGKF